MPPAFCSAPSILETDIDEIPGLTICLVGLREPGFVTVDRRDVEETGQGRTAAPQTSRTRDSARAWLAETKVEHFHQHAAGINRFFGSRGSPNLGRA